MIPDSHSQLRLTDFRQHLCDLGAKPSHEDRLLHAFQKKTQQTRKEDIALAAARYKQLKESAK